MSRLSFLTLIASKMASAHTRLDGLTTFSRSTNVINCSLTADTIGFRSEQPVRSAQVDTAWNMSISGAQKESRDITSFRAF